MNDITISKSCFDIILFFGCVVRRGRKSVNADTELTSTTIRDTSLFKKLVGRRPAKTKEKIGERVIHAYMLRHMISQLNIS
jgi:hypothetical protein